MAIMTILVGAMASAVLVAGHALPDKGGLSERKAAAVEAVERISRDLVLATTFLAAEPDRGQFTVPDRGHADAGPETVFYSWSGTLGDPLIHRYNASPVIELCEDVHYFSLEYTRKAKPLAGTPRVLLLVEDPWSITAQETARQALIEKWGFPVRVMAGYASAAEFQADASNYDVVYVGTPIQDVSGAIKDLPKGIACEDGDVRVGLGFGKSSVWFASSSISILDNSHYITAPFSIGTLNIVESNQNLMAVRLGIAAGATVLAEDGFYGYSTLVSIESGAALYESGTAAARRVALPWGFESTFDFQTVNADGLRLMRRAVVWAAAPIGICRVKITLQLGSDTAARVETEVQLLNMPEEQ
jgi:hypothetical protein